MNIKEEGKYYAQWFASTELSISAAAQNLH